MADQLIRAGEHEIVVAGGMESMTQAPHLLPKSREGFKYGDVKLVDSMAYDALYDQFTDQPMGGAHRELQRRGRQPHPRGAGRVLRRAPTSGPPRRWKNGLFDDEIVPVEIPQRKGDPVVVSQDEGIRGDTTAESLSKLRPAFDKDGTITAGSASQISDGACAVVVMSKAKAEELGPDLARRDRRVRPGRRPRLHAADAARQRDHQGVRRRRASTSADLDLVEINEAFAAVGIVSARELGLDEDKVNVNGGAIALGHPVGMSGARIALHLALELKRRGGGIGAAALCGGGGQGDALILHVPRDAESALDRPTTPTSAAAGRRRTSPRSSRRPATVRPGRWPG